MAYLSINDIHVNDKDILVRVDFNVPLTGTGEISDDSRIRMTLPTLENLLERGGRIILMSHLGRPNGKKESALSLEPCAKRLSELLKREVLFCKELPSCRLNEPITLLENVRFYPEEEHPELSTALVDQLANLGDYYVNDAFGAAHRAHATISELPKKFPGKTAAGLLMQRELKFLCDALNKPKRPFYAFIGGAKVSSKIGTIKALLDKADTLFIGGGMAYTFLKAQGHPIGNSLYEESMLDNAKEILEYAGKRVYLPIDFICSRDIKENAQTQVVTLEAGIPDNSEAADIGPATIKLWTTLLKDAQTIFWNGPVGIFEINAFAEGTKRLALAIADSSAITIAGGGDSLAAIHTLNLKNKFTHISSGGGAILELIEFGTLPGIDAISLA